MPAVNESGILVIDKPEGMSSARVVSTVKRISGGAKTGHTGTLDPFATGLMICGINSGTRISRFFLSGDKTYIADLYLGVETDTLDRTGSVIGKHPGSIESDFSDRLTQDAILLVLERFMGTIEQIPPAYSALKHQGVPLYKLARKGTPVIKPPRIVTIHAIRIIAIDLPIIRIEVSCSSGTYIRSLASDIGKAIGCGAHLSALRRTETCGFTLGDAVPLDELASPSDCQAHLIPMATALTGMTTFMATPELSNKIRHGMKLYTTDIVSESFTDADYIKILDSHKRLIAIVEYDNDHQAYNYCCVFHY